MNFEWDEGKNKINVTKHGFNFTDARRIFDFPILENIDNREDYGEERLVGIGLLDRRVVVVVYTEVNEYTIRLISLRKALPHERKQYERYIKDRLG